MHDASGHADDTAQQTVVSDLEAAEVFGRVLSYAVDRGYSYLQDGTSFFLIHASSAGGEVDVVGEVSMAELRRDAHQAARGLLEAIRDYEA